MDKYVIFDHLIETMQYIGGFECEITTAPDTSIISGYSSPIFNFVRFNTKNKQKINQLKGRNIPFMCLPSQKMENDFEQFANEEGLHQVDWVTASFKNLKDFEYNPNQAIEMRTVEKEEDLLIFDKVSSKVFEHQEKLAFSFLRPVLNCFEIRLLLAYLDNSPVGCAMLSLIGNDAGLYWVGVLPEFRKRGVGRELVHFRMNLAKTLDRERIVAQNMTPTTLLYKNMDFSQPGRLPLYVCERQFFIF